MSKETGKKEMTKEELAKAWKEYYDWLASIYPLAKFQIQGKNGEQLNFYHGFTNRFSGETQPRTLTYILRDEKYAEAYEEQKQHDLLGESRNGKNAGEAFKSKAFIDIWPEDKVFNFGVDWDYQGLGYGISIYDNYLQILEMLGIEEREQYKLKVYGNPKHDFFKRIQTRELVSKTNGEPNTENALQILADFAKHPHTMRFRELNAIIQYAINSNVSMEAILQAINENGFNISYGTINGIPRFEEKDFEQFKSFGITGLKPTCMHEHFMRGKNFGFMQLLGDVDVQDATLEFRRIFEEVKKEYETKKAEDGYIHPNLKDFGELEHIILDWEYSGLLFKNVTPDIKRLVKKQAISKFDEFDPEHRKSWDFQLDSNSAATLKMLKDAGLLDKDAYIQLYQKALNRNYNLEEFDAAIYPYITAEERELARREISQNVYYPSPKNNWQRSQAWGQEHRISKVDIPQRVGKKGKVREVLKKEIIGQGIARKTKIKTDMTGIGKDGKPFIVDNLKDWLFGVPGAHGNLQLMGNTAVTFPPQTPKFAVELIEEAFKSLENPDLDAR